MAYYTLFRAGNCLNLVQITGGKSFLDAHQYNKLQPRKCVPWMMHDSAKLRIFAFRFINPKNLLKKNSNCYV